MKRYQVQFDDGEFICSYYQLKDARKYRRKNNFNYISRSIRIYDAKSMNILLVNSGCNTL